MSLLPFDLARPWWLLALLPLGLLVWRLWRALQGEAAWRQAVDAHLLRHLLVGDARPRRVGIVLLAFGLLLAVLALAGPVQRDGTVDAYRRDALRVLVVDLSARIEPARLERVRLKLLDLLRALPEGQTALLVYAGEPYLVAPPTTDVETLARFVPELAADVVPVPGDRPERALAMAGGLVGRSGAAAGDVLWITAGGERLELLPTFNAARLSILDVAAVADHGLAALAARSGGAYVRMTADAADVRALAAAFADRGGWSAGERHAASAAERGYWLLLPLLPLAALAFRRGLLTVLLVPLLVGGLLTPRPAAAVEAAVPAALADGLAWRRLQAGDAAAAAAAFRDPRWRAAAHYRGGEFAQAAAALAGIADADAHYNRGNALARNGRLSEALAAYDAALALRPDDADTRHNRDIVQRLLKPPQNDGKAPPSGKPPANRTPPTPANAAEADGEQEAARLAEQWLRQVPDEPAGLLRRKLLSEHRRRQAGEVKPLW